MRRVSTLSGREILGFKIGDEGLNELKEIVVEPAHLVLHVFLEDQPSNLNLTNTALENR